MIQKRRRDVDLTLIAELSSSQNSGETLEWQIDSRHRLVAQNDDAGLIPAAAVFDDCSGRTHT